MPRWTKQRKEARKPSRPHSGPPSPRPAPKPPPPKPPASGKTPPASSTSCAPAPPPSWTGSAPIPPASGKNSASSCRTRPVISPRHGTPSGAAPSEPNTTSTPRAPNWPSYVPRPQPQTPPARQGGAGAARPRKAKRTLGALTFRQESRRQAGVVIHLQKTASSASTCSSAWRHPATLCNRLILKTDPQRVRSCCRAGDHRSLAKILSIASGPTVMTGRIWWRWIVSVTFDEL
jgi:hypothetical protein